MASPGVVSVMTSSAGSPEAEEALRAAAMLEERRRRRKQSNRESARRSRERRQRQLKELAAQAAALRARNSPMASALQAAEWQCAAVEAENALLTAQALELGARLQSLTDLLHCMDAAAAMQPQAQLDMGMYCYY